MDAIRCRRSVREFDSRPIPPDLLEQVTEALRLAPSACNHQPWRFIMVRDAALREQVAHACHEQMFIAPAPVIVAACAEPAKAYPRMGGSWNSVDVDVAIALDHLMLAAAEAGLGTCWIGAFDEGAVKALLGVPAEAKVVALTPLGYPKRADLIHPIDPAMRKPRAEVFSENHY
jgi:nitroreductase